MTGVTYAGFFPRAIIGSETIEDHIFEAGRQFNRDLGGNAIGEAVFDPTSVGITMTASADPINNRKLTLVGNLPCISDDGEFIQVGNAISLETEDLGAYTPIIQDPAWFVDLPYQNVAATTYRVYIGKTAYPIDIGVARDGSRGYRLFVDAPGWSVNPNTVIDNGTGLTLRLNAVLTALGMQLWATTNTDDPAWSYDCVVYLDTDQTGVEIATDDPEEAIVFGKLVKDPATSAWMVKTDAFGNGYLGQDAPIDTDATHYKVIILGPLITTTNFNSDPAYIFIGTVLSGGVETISTTGQNITSPYATYAAGFGVEHVNIPGDPDLGRHTQVTAPVDDDIVIAVDSASTKRVIVRGIGAGLGILLVEDQLEVETITPITATNNVLVRFTDNASDRTFEVRNTSATKKGIVRAGKVEAKTTFNGTGEVSADIAFVYNAGTVGVHWGSFSAREMWAYMDPAVVTFTGGGTQNVDIAGVEHENIWVGPIGAAGAGDSLQFFMPIDIPEGFEISTIRVNHRTSGAGVPGSITFALIEWLASAVAPAAPLFTVGVATKTGAFVEESIAVAPVTPAKTQTSVWYMRITLTNDSVAGDTTALGHWVIIGKPSKEDERIL